MPALYTPKANILARVIMLVPLLGLTGIVAALFLYNYSPYVTGVGMPISQPVPFSHEHHVGGLGIDCRYCHTSVENSGFAGLPPSETCMNCHLQLYTDSPLLEPVRDSWRSGEPIHWNRVNSVPDFVYFDHSVHVNGGVACIECHGRVDEMPLTWKDQTLYMQWCLQCHRHPDEAIRPREAVFDMNAEQPTKQVSMPWEQWQREPSPRTTYALHTASITNCSACHR